MGFTYQNEGDLLYGIEEYMFRYRNQEATIRLSNMDILNEDGFIFRVIIHDEDVPNHYKDFYCNDYEFLKEFGTSNRGQLKTRENALQLAIDQAGMVLEKYGSAAKRAQQLKEIEGKFQGEN